MSILACSGVRHPMLEWRLFRLQKIAMSSNSTAVASHHLHLFPEAAVFAARLGQLSGLGLRPPGRLCRARGRQLEPPA
ncbi:hypothetical protein JMM61_19290 [Rhodovulum sulfidophilum]|uniref:hypothetical protein n=1 Tax=Rhodovulum sulfidophilum TaxID=35806 RepID=UPI0019270D20|nr:hypothetical protein [Rhodovulum sulfidophilum]MBL3587489.1 hypothetical protein [Rhodovulum sulfidophilum]